MRHAIAVLVLVGCGDPASGPTVEIYPGPVATVAQGNLLQLAVRVDPPTAATFDLSIDDPVAALFDVHEITPTATGAIVSLVPKCTALNGAPSGVVSMSVGAPGIPRASLTIDIVADTDGVCDAAPEHAVTVANLQVANVPDSGHVLCTRATVAQTSAHDELREVLRIYGPTGAMTGNGKMLCGVEDVRLELWPPIDAPAVETIQVDTFACAIDGCKLSPSACCDADSGRATKLTSSPLAVPIRSVAEVDDSVDGITLACAELAAGKPSIILATTNKTTAEISDAGRFTRQIGPHVTNLLGLTWQPGSSGVESTIVGSLTTGGVTSNVRAALGSDGVVTWIADPRLQFAATPDAMTPIPTTAGGGARYVARFASGGLELTCISDSCAAGTVLDITVNGQIPIGFGIADYDGDGGEDFIVAYRDQTGTIGGSAPVHLHAFKMAWNQATPASVLHLPLLTLDAPGYDVHIAAVASHGGSPCERIFVLSRGGFSALDEITSTCGGSPTFDARTIPIVNDVRSIATVDQRLIAATALGVFELKQIGVNSSWRLQDPLLDEHLLTTGETLIDSTSRYGEQFVPCLAATPSIVFRIARGGFEWTELDARVQTFSAGSAP